MLKKLMVLILKKVIRPTWVTMFDEVGPEIALNIFGVNIGYYKDHKPLYYTDKNYRPVIKREYGETIRPNKTENL